MNRLEQDVKQVFGEKFEQLDFKFSIISKNLPFFAGLVYKASCLNEIISLCKFIFGSDYVRKEYINEGELKDLLKKAIVCKYSELLDEAVELENKMNDLYYSKILPDLIEEGYISRIDMPVYYWGEDEK